MQSNHNTFHNKPLPDVITLNVGGSIHTTSLATLQKSSQSMLAAMFSGRHSFTVDSQGRFFIDRNGHLFHHVLNFLRQGDLPPLNESWDVYQEAQFYNIVEMCEALEVLRPVAGEKLRRSFLEQVPSYHSNLRLLLSSAQHNVLTQPERISKLRVCIFKDDSYSRSHEGKANGDENQSVPKHNCDVSVTFGPWRGAPGVYDVIDCIRLDLEAKGYEMECQCIGVCDQLLYGAHFCKRPIFEFKFKWW